jgi:hypothetical protein
LLWEPINIAQHDTARVVKLDGRAYLIRSEEYSLSLMDGATAATLWKLSAPEGSPRPPQWGNTLIYGQQQEAPAIVQPAPDLDGDGQQDLVWAVRSSASLWAISGKGTADKKGRELWWFTAGPGQTIGMPAVADVDGDGTPDLVTMFANPQGAVWIEAVNGKTGKSLWRSPLETAWFGGAPDSRWSPSIVQHDGQQRVVCIAGTRFVGLDLKTGAASWPAVDLGLEPVMVNRTSSCSASPSLTRSICSPSRERHERRCGPRRCGPNNPWTSMGSPISGEIAAFTRS